MKGKDKKLRNLSFKSEGTINGIIRFLSKEGTNSKTKKKLKENSCSNSQMGARIHANPNQRNLTCSEYPHLEQSQE